MSKVSAGGRGFRSWAGTANQTRMLTLQRAVASFVPQLESAGFLWVDKSFDCGSVPAHIVNLEREVVPGRIDYVQIIFDKRHRARFQLIFGAKEKSPPHLWVRSGALVWKKKSESVEYKWWGARWWNLDKEEALVNAVDAVASLFPQLLRFLSDGVAGNNVWEAKLEGCTIVGP